MPFTSSSQLTPDLTDATRLLSNATVTSTVAPGLTDTTATATTRSTSISLGTAINNGAIAGRQVLPTNDVGNGDLWDVQQFQLAATSDVTFTLSGLQADADLYIVRDFNGNGQWDFNTNELLASSVNSGTTPESISISGLAPGNYYAIVATYDGLYTNYSLAVTTDAAGNSLASARSLATTTNGTLNGSVSVNDFVGTSDRNDFYTFQTPTTSNFQLSLTGLTADADVYLFQDSNANGSFDTSDILVSSRQVGTSAESINVSGLAAGRYFVDVAQYSGDTNYTLAITANGTDNSLDTARNLGTLSGNLTLNDFVGNSDPVDFYSFQTTTTSNFQLSMTGLTADADVYLIQDSNQNGSIDAGDVLVSSQQSGTNSESISYTGLAAGRYFVGVYQYSGNTDYTLSMTTDTAGNTLATARNLGTLNGTINVNDFVGSSDPVDVYTFQTTGTSNFQLAMTGLAADADVYLIQDSNQNGSIDTGDVLAYSAAAGTSAEAINYAGLAAGRYFVAVSQYSGNTNYALSLTATTGDVGNNYATAADVGLVSGQVIRTGSVGGTDLGDVYHFSTNATSNLQLNLTGLTADANLFLVQDVNQNGVYDAGDLLAFSTNTGTTAEQINRTDLAAGSYFAWVTANSGSAITNYNLTLTTDAAGNTLGNARDLGILNSASSYSDFVGNSDTRDFYRFQVASPTTVNVSLSGLTADADLTLIRDVNGNGAVDSGDIVAASLNSGTTAENLTATLATGTYFVQVNQYVPTTATSQTPTDTNYVLRLTPVASTTMA